MTLEKAFLPEIKKKNKESDVLYLWCGNDFYYFLYGEFDSDKRKQ